MHKTTLLLALLLPVTTSANINISEACPDLSGRSLKTCLDEQVDAATKYLDSAYDSFTEKLTQPQQDALKEAQSAWESLNTINCAWANDWETEYQCKIESIMYRVVELKGYSERLLALTVPPKSLSLDTACDSPLLEKAVTENVNTMLNEKMPGLFVTKLIKPERVDIKQDGVSYCRMDIQFSNGMTDKSLAAILKHDSGEIELRVLPNDGGW